MMYCCDVANAMGMRYLTKKNKRAVENVLWHSVLLFFFDAPSGPGDATPATWGRGLCLCEYPPQYADANARRV